MTKVKIRKIGNSLGVVLPKDMLDQLHLAEGDHLDLTQNGEGLALSKSTDDEDALMAEAEAIMAKRFNVLRALSK
ncbi:MAG: AbrB/MazE/SpoVT family DNA-binding domain-containing protein [Hirschia sp.]|nr:AbrB/MazE/SpoVT family DNA-binding domain-containing protein [Hirschia sp.]MBF17577.1 AbrB/MazE/SpoVT family DNA-binding domain-containing protein [Hirschia sp.]|tara:strand:- start:238 stop:462 length:225 start_codon:yes stop_codon:yes gene_type:complete